MWLRPFFGGMNFSTLSVKRIRPDLVVVLDRAEGDGGAGLGDQLPLQLLCRSEIGRTAHVGNEHHGEFAFLFEDLHEGMPETRRHVPVDRAHLIARRCIHAPR